MKYKRKEDAPDAMIAAGNATQARACARKRKRARKQPEKNLGEPYWRREQ